MADIEPPPGKRRKIESVGLTNLSRYICIERKSARLECTSPYQEWSLTETPLTIQSTSPRRTGTLAIRVRVCNQKEVISLSLAAGERNRNDLETALERAAQLDTPWKYGDNLLKLPLACAVGNITECSPGPGETSASSLDFCVSILWLDTAYPFNSVQQSLRDLLWQYLPAVESKPSTWAQRWDPREFYQNVHIPEKLKATSAKLEIHLIHSTLYPFQRRAVRWLLSREGVSLNEQGRVLISKETGQDRLLPAGFAQTTDADGRPCYVNHALGTVTSDLLQIHKPHGHIKGGILAEEMGLGKTVELLALICLNQRTLHKESETTDNSLKRTGATLIITPPAILEQWKQEIRHHAPSLRVQHYEGVRSLAKQKNNVLSDLADADIVLTTYNVASNEVHYVAEKPDRALRSKPRYESPKSPLIQLEWWRVCLDEAQMVESGVSAAATVARLVPRINAWAVSGTPIKGSHKDLFGLLLFLRYEPWCHSIRLWNRLVDYHRPLFQALISDIAIRHNKDFVREDLRLPPQSRHTITVPFTPIEEQYYSQLFYQMCEDCGLNRDGEPIEDDWDSDDPSTAAKMRGWLTRLRQTCLHPEVGGRNRKALGRSGGPLRSVLQVLDVMIDQNDTSVRQEQRTLLLSQVKRGQILENAKDTEAAQKLWKEAYGEASKIVTECRAQYETEVQVQKAAKAAAEDAMVGGEDDDDSMDDDSSLTTHRQRLRSALEVQHICIFFIANAYYQLKSNEDKIRPESEEFTALGKQETEAYEQAKKVRTELLTEVLKKANRLIINVRVKADKLGFVEVPSMNLPLDYTGIESRKVFEKLDRYCEAMNTHREAFLSLRQKMIDLLKQSLIDEDEGVELQGDEYENSTKHQDEMYAYMEALRALFADRSDAISGQENTLIRHEMKQLLRSAKEGEGPAPELLVKLLAERDVIRIPTRLGSLRGIVTEIRHLITALQWQEGNSRARAELTVANDILQHAQSLMTAQSKSIAALEQEVNQFRDTMNSRLDYYRALQKISDTVAPYDEEKAGQPVDDDAFDWLLEDEAHRSEKLSTLLSKKRYLAHLKNESASSSTTRICTICQCEFEVGTLTVCGHQFCKECIRLWYGEHKNCPVCKRRLKGTDFWDITYKPSELAIQEETTISVPQSPESDNTLDKSIYSDISTATLNEIKDVDLHGASFGSKVDTICRHLFWLRDHDPGSKAILFSQYREFLDVLGRAFKQYRIAYTRFDDRDGIERFKTDPAIECFLLHAKAHATGLNLVVANHVFLCEPLINTAIELQAIARVHRIGQQRATTVWMYLVAETVEESICEISVTRRLAHMRGKSRATSSRSGTATPNMENAIDAANSLELQTADLSKLLTSGKSGGELVEKEDLWRCLFGRTKQKAPAVSQASVSASGEIGRFLRAEAAEKRIALPSR